MGFIMAQLSFLESGKIDGRLTPLIERPAVSGPD
jgi:hypothetical protein